MAISADCGLRTDSAGVGHRSVSGRNVRASTNRPQYSYTTGAVRQFSSIEQEDVSIDRQASWKETLRVRDVQLLPIFASQKSHERHRNGSSCMSSSDGTFLVDGRVVWAERQSSTRTVVVDSPFSLCFGGPTFAERSGVGGTGR